MSQHKNGSFSSSIWLTVPRMAIGLALTLFGAANAEIFECNDGNTKCLIEAIELSNANNEADVISLGAGIYKLTTINSISSNSGTNLGPNGLPEILTPIRITGESAVTTVIRRSKGTPIFRIFSVGREGELTLEGVTIAGGTTNAEYNATGLGGGISNYGNLEINGCIIEDNQSVSGGGIYTNSGEVRITDTTLIRNTSLSIGGGIYNDYGLSPGIVMLKNCSFIENSALNGGAIENTGIMTLTNVTIAKNIANKLESGGAGIFNTGEGTVWITSSTISRNEAIGHGGGIRSSIGSPIYLLNTILSENEALLGSPDCVGDIVSLGYNLIGSPCLALRLTDLVGAPGLDELVVEEEPGKIHYPLLVNSQAIDKGDDTSCLPNDQLDNPRVDGDSDGNIVCDIGAVEFQVGLLNIDIDIKPTNKYTIIRPGSKGYIWVALLSSTDPGTLFDPSSQVNIPTVVFGTNGAVPIRHYVNELNMDGLDDLLLQFKITETGIACGDNEASLTGEKFDGQSFTGTDSIKTVGCRHGAFQETSQ